MSSTFDHSIKAEVKMDELFGIWGYCFIYI